MSKFSSPVWFKAAIFTFAATALAVSHAHAQTQVVQLQEATATFSQTGGGGPYSPALAIDGLYGQGGWTIDHFPGPGEFTLDEIAVFETVSDLGPSLLTFTMHFLEGAGHLLGRFRWSVTTDDRSTFADGLRTGGDVTANWTILSSPVVAGPAGMTFTTLADESVLAGGTVPGQGVYEVSAEANLSGITGIRLEVFKDPSLPAGGPGFAANGNFVLTELVVTADPIPQTVTIEIGPRRDVVCVNPAPVAILGSADFDVTNINADTLMFGDEESATNNGPGRRCSLRDVNGDGILDLVCQFIAGTGEANLSGELFDGTSFEGTDSICVVR